VSGHDFSRAAQAPQKERGFSPRGSNRHAESELRITSRKLRATNYELPSKSLPRKGQDTIDRYRNLALPGGTPPIMQLHRAMGGKPLIPTGRIHAPKPLPAKEFLAKQSPNR